MSWLLRIPMPCSKQAAWLVQAVTAALAALPAAAAAAHKIGNR